MCGIYRDVCRSLLDCFEELVAEDFHAADGWGAILLVDVNVESPADAAMFSLHIFLS